jgi:adenylosuccinate synthase
MPVDILLGFRWGDKVEGKIIDYMTPTYKVLAHFQIKPNAGHILVIHYIKHVLHQIPSGIFNPASINVIGNGVVLYVCTLQKEATA